MEAEREWAGKAGRVAVWWTTHPSFFVTHITASCIGLGIATSFIVAAHVAASHLGLGLPPLALPRTRQPGRRGCVPVCIAAHAVVVGARESTLDDAVGVEYTTARESTVLVGTVGLGYAVADDSWLGQDEGVGIGAGRVGCYHVGGWRVELCVRCIAALARDEDIAALVDGQ